MKLLHPLPLLSLVAGDSLANAAAQDLSGVFFGGKNGTTYTAWLQEASYDKSIFLPSKDEGCGVALHWTIDGTHIHVGVAAEATGWVGLGLAESGSMRGADIVLFTAETNELIDSYVLDQLVTPFPDNCQSWTLVDSVVENDYIIFEATRLLDTGDSQDRVIINDSSSLITATRVIAAWGDTSSPSYHGANNTARRSVRFFGNITDELVDFQASMEAEAEGSFLIHANNYLIPSSETVYEHFCFSREDLLALNVSLDQPLHNIGIEPMLDSRTSTYVHHFVVYGSVEPWNSSSSCYEEFPGFEIVYVWAPGDLPFSLPSNVGQPLGVFGFQSLKLEIHYNNPSGDLGNMDSSGVLFHYTSKKRKYDMGVYQNGDPGLSLMGQPVSTKNGLVEHTFDCTSLCSSNYTTQRMTVIREHLHMHQAGVSVMNIQSRDGQVIRQGEVQFWDFQQQGNLAVVEDSFDILPGDSFRTICNYDATNGQVFGLGSQDEMCIAFIFYYPRQPFYAGCGVGYGDFFPGCEATATSRELTSLSQVGRTFGTAPAACPADVEATTATDLFSSNSPVSSPNAGPSNAPSSLAVETMPGLGQGFLVSCLIIILAL